jgi:hypothetical protein
VTGGDDGGASKVVTKFKISTSRNEGTIKPKPAGKVRSVQYVTIRGSTFTFRGLGGPLGAELGKAEFIQPT